MGLLTLIGRIELNASAAHAAIKGVRGAVGSLASSAFGGLKGQLAGIISVGFLVNETRKLIEYGSEIHDTAEKIGISTDKLQEFGYAAKQSGSNIEAVAKAFRGLAKARQAALLEPGGAEAQAFKAVGADPRSANLAATFEKIAEAVRTTNFGAGTEPLIEKLLGKGGVELIPAFVEGLKQASDEMERLGIRLDQDVIDRLDEMGDILTRLQYQIRGPLVSAFLHVADIVLGIVDNIQGALVALEVLKQEKASGRSGWLQTVMDAIKLANPFAAITDPAGMKAAAQRLGGLWSAVGNAFATGRTDSRDDRNKAAADRDAAAEAERKRIANRPVREFTFDKKPMAPLSDSLTQIGNFLGTDPSAKTIERLSRIEQYLRSIDEKTERRGAFPEFP